LGSTSMGAELSGFSFGRGSFKNTDGLPVLNVFEWYTYHRSAGIERKHGFQELKRCEDRRLVQYESADRVTASGGHSLP